jgi:hypothetical protein
MDISARRSVEHILLNVIHSFQILRRQKISLFSREITGLEKIKMRQRMRMMMKNMHGSGKLFLTLILVGFVAFTLTACAPKAERSPLKFNITLSEEAFRGIQDLGLEVPVKGRVFAIISIDKENEPRLSTGVTGVPLWGMDVTDLQGGEMVVIEDGKKSVRGYPLDNTWEIPSGDYVVQAFLNVYTTFHRADGHTLEMHLNSGAHQNLFRAP